MSAISKAAPRRSATRTSCTPRSSNWWRSTMPRSSIRRCRTGIPGDAEGRGGIYNFVTKRGDCRGDNSKISWTQVETGSAITWKYPSCILRGDNSRGEFYSIAISNGHQQVNSGTKMIHLGKNTSSRIISKGIAAGRSQNTYRGLVTAHRKATGARNFTNCDSLLIGDNAARTPCPTSRPRIPRRVFEHEATTSKISEDMLFYCLQRGLSPGRGRRPGRQWFRQGRAAAIADGVRGRSAEADLDQPGRERRIIGTSRRLQHSTEESAMTPLLEIENLHAEIGGRKILNGLDLVVEQGEMHAIMGPNGAGKSTLSYVLAGKPGYEVTGAKSCSTARTCWTMAPDERAARGLFLAFQYPIEIPGVATVTFLRAAFNAQRNSAVRRNCRCPELLKRVREIAAKLEIDPEMLRRPLNVGFSGGEKKRNETLQMALLEPRLCVLDETDSGLDIDALKVVADGVNRLRSPERGMIVITHYQRLLNHIVPDMVHVLSGGRIVRTGGKELALKLEATGYAQYQSEAA